LHSVTAITCSEYNLTCHDATFLVSATASEVNASIDAQRTNNTKQHKTTQNNTKQHKTTQNNTKQHKTTITTTTSHSYL
jgi:hypothetical protein